VIDVPTPSPRDPVEVVPEHDHAWRRVRVPQENYGGVSEYRCDLCDARWSM